MGTNSLPLTLLKKLGLTLLPIMALVMLLTVVQPAGTVNADPGASTGPFDTVGGLPANECRVTVDAVTTPGGAEQATAFDADCNGNLTDVDTSGAGTTGGTNNSAGTCPQVNTDNGSLCSSLVAAVAAEDGDGFGVSHADADSTITTCVDPADGSPAPDSGPVICISESGAASASEDIGSATSFSNSTIDNCGTGADNGVGGPASCIATAGAATTAGDCDFDGNINANDADLCVALGVANTVLDCDDATCVGSSRTVVNVEDCDNDADCTSGSVVASAIIQSAGGPGCTTLATCTATATADVIINGCGDDTLCNAFSFGFPNPAGVPTNSGTSDALAFIDPCTDNAICVATASIDIVIADCQNEAQCTAGADAIAAVLDCNGEGLGDETECTSTATSVSTIGELCEAADLLAGGDCFGLGLILGEAVPGSGCDDGAECDAQSNAVALIDDGPDAADGFSCQSGATCTATAEAEASIEECDDEANCDALADAFATILDCGNPAGIDEDTSCLAVADADASIDGCGEDDAVRCLADAFADAFIVDCTDKADCRAFADAEAEIEDCTVQSDCEANATAEASIGDICNADDVAEGACTVLGSLLAPGCTNDVLCIADAEAVATIDDCIESICAANAEAEAEIENCNGNGLNFTDEFMCLATALAVAEVEFCDPTTCTADAIAEAEIENCEGDSNNFTDGDTANFGVNCIATAISLAKSINGSQADSTSIAEVDGCNDDECDTMGAAIAIATGGAWAEDYSQASALNLADADGDGSTAIAMGLAMCVDDHDDDALTPNRVYSACAYNGSEATQVASADAEAGGLATALSGALATDGGEAIATAVVSAEGFLDVNKDGDRDFDCDVDPNIVDNCETGSVAFGTAQAIAMGDNNVANAETFADATGGATAATGSFASSAVTNSVAGAAAGNALACTNGMVSCGFSSGLALAGSGEGLALATSTGDANQGQSVEANVVAAVPVAPLSATTSGCGSPLGAYTTMTANADGSWSFSSGFNVGAACVDANATAKP